MNFTTNERSKQSPRFSGRCLPGVTAFALLLASQLAWAQTTYYVASNGSDANNGRSSGSAFQTISKVNTLSLRPGDAILLRRGDTFRGTLQISQSGSSGSPIVIDAYGSGNKPVISGSVPVSGWNRVNGNVWQASCAACGSQVTGVYRNETALPLGRYPNLSDANKGYLTIQSHNGNNQFTSQQGLSTNWTGGEVVERPVQWILDRSPITGQNGNTLTINNTSSYGLSDGWGFFIQKHPATLDQTGEWYYNPANKTIQLYDGGDPNGQPITATAFDAGINLKTSSFITVRNLRITETTNSGIAADGGAGLTFSDNEIINSGFDGIDITGANSTLLMENNLIQDANNTGASVQGYQNFTFRGNTLRRIGMVAGLGKSGDGGYTGLLSGANQNVLVENNLLEGMGYIGISLSANTLVRYNQISNFCTTKSDGAGIYSWNGNGSNPGGMRIQSNIVYNGVGAPEGTPGSSYSGANGIFLDDCSQNSEISNNSTFNSRGKGILIRGAKNVTIKDNTSFNNGEEQLKLNFNEVCLLSGNTIINNILFSKYADQGVAEYESSRNDLATYANFDNNYYVRPFEDLFKIRAVYNPGSGLTGGNFTLAEWQSRWGQDRNSYNSPITYKSEKVGQTGATLLDQPFSSNTNGWNGYSPYGNGRIDWDNTNRLDGGSMRLSFPSASNKNDSYLLAFINIGAVRKGQTYQLLFDGVASGQGKRIQLYPRQLSGSYRDLSDRASFILGSNRQRNEATFVANADESNAVLIIQVYEDGQTAWIDNLQLREATLTPVNPDDFIKLYYNATAQSKVQSLDGTYRDAKNQQYSGQITIAPFSSVVLLKENSDTPPPPPPVALRDPENPANAVGGLNYQYYEGTWTSLPDFNFLTPNKTGSGSNPTLSVRNREIDYGLRYTGFVSVPTDGVYTFYTASDDGSKLLIGTTEVVNNDGNHPVQERSGTIGLKAGVHALSVLFYQGSGGQDLTVSYEGPGIGKQTIPDAAYRRTDTGGTTNPPTAGTGTGLRGEYFNNVNLAAPVVVSRVDATVNFDWGQGSPASGVNIDFFSVRWSGQVEAPVSGNYTFSTTNDDGLRLWVNGQLLIDDWNGHAPKDNTGPTISLTAGQKYDIRVEYFDNIYGAVVQVKWAYPGQGQQIVPQQRLYPASGTTNPPTAGTGTGLRGEYFNNVNLAAPVVVSRVDATVNFDWGQGSPASGVNIDFFSVRWSGQVEAPVSGNYTFSTTNDDGLRLWVNGQLLIDDWNGHAPKDNTGPTISLTAGQKYDIRVEYFDNIYGAVVQVKWAYPGQDQQIVPQQRLYPANSGGRVAALGGGEFTPEQTMVVFPVPARDEIQVRYYAETPGDVSLQLTTLSGQVGLEASHPVVAGENTMRIPVRALHRGYYVLTLSQGSQRITRKVLLTE